MIRSGLLAANRLGAALQSRQRNLYYRALGMQLRGYVWMRAVEVPREHPAIELEAGCALDRGVVLLCSGPAREAPKIAIGARSYLNRHVFLDATQQLWLGRDCAIGPGCYLTDHDHGREAGIPPLAQPMVTLPTCIGDRVWIGANATVLKGVTVGNEAIIGAGSVVTKNIPAAGIATGVPAKVKTFKTDSRSNDKGL